jgi:hypothetical protein
MPRPCVPVYEPHEIVVGVVIMFTFLDSVRQPEYTGANRCWPCTITNVAIAGVLTVGASVVGTPILGALVFGVSLAAIWLRGYLIPGTPELTQRYFPDWLLALFDKDPRRTGGREIDLEGLTAETVLREAGVVVDDPAVGDVVLTPDFEQAWDDRMAEIGSGRTDREELAELVDVAPETLDVHWHNNAFTAKMDGVWIGQWESRAAFVADMAAGRELDARYPAWRDLPMLFRSEVLGGLRVMLDRCPDCDGQVVLGQDVVKSCCRTYDVLAGKCDSCGARLFEIDWNEELFGSAEPDADEAHSVDTDTHGHDSVVTVESDATDNTIPVEPVGDDRT